MKLALLLLFVASNFIQKSATFENPFVAILANSQLEISPKCGQEFSEYFANLTIDKNSWSLQMLDATSKLPSGLLSLNFGEMGDFQQCIKIKVASNYSGTILGKYCLGYVSLTNQTTTNNHAQFSSLKTGSLGDLGNIAQRTGGQGPVWALCLPDGCSTDDANTIGNYIFTNLFGPEIGIDFPEMLCQTANDVEKELSAGAIITIVIIAVLIALVLASTLYDMYYIFYKHETCHIMLKAFSAYSNGAKLFKMTKSSPDQLPCLNGLKFISMMWVVSGHQYSVTIMGPITNTKYVMEWANSLYSMFLISGTLSVDTFLTIGGALMSYGFMKANSKNVPFNIFLYYLHRYLRLTAPFAIVVLVSSTLLEYMGSGPRWPFVKLFFQQNCEDYWWSALLYVQNYVNVSHMCLGQTWYLSIDMQLYVISPLVFFALWKWPKICIPFLVLSILGIMGGSFYVAWANDLTAILSNFYGNSTDFSNKYYLLTHTRAAPWVIGVILGYFIFKIKQNQTRPRLHKIVVLILWATCLAVLLACVLGGHSTLRSKDYDRMGNSWHIALVRPVWAFAISWIVLACTTNYGGPINWFLSLPIYQVLNRFTYSIYLTHVTMLYMMIYDKKWPDYFSDFNMAYQFWGTLWFSTGLAVILVFISESPIIIIEKILFGKTDKKMKSARTEDPERGVENPSFEK